MKTIALVNPAAGSVPEDGLEHMSEALKEAGVHDADIVILDPEDCQSQLTGIADASPDLMIVWGGDGTLRSAMSLAGQRTSNLLLLPGGTMNMLTKAIHGDLPWQDILKNVLTSPQRRTIPAGKANDHLFYCAMIAGAPVKLAEAREAVRRGDVVKAAVEARSALEAMESLHLEARFRNGYDSSGRLPHTNMIAALVGPLSRGGGMEIAALSDLTTGGTLGLMWSSIVSDWRLADNVEIINADRMTIEAEEDEDIPILVDGEAVEAGQVVRVSFVPEAAQCLTAASSA